MKTIKRNRGFTLVEMIIVLVILAILLAVLVPGMTQWIKKARYQQAFEECRAVVLSAQGLAAERYGKDETAPAVPADEAEILKLAGVPGGTAIRTLNLNDDNTEVERLLYRASDTTLVLYDQGVYSIFVGSLGDEEIRDQVIDSMDNGTTRVDSGAIGLKNTGDVDSFASMAVAELKKNGIDLTALNAVSWHWEKGNGNSVFLWTDQDIKTREAGTSVAFIQYSTKTGCYSVWTSTVVEKDYNGVKIKVLNPGGTEYTKSLSDEEKTYANAVKALKEAQKKTGEIS